MFRKHLLGVGPCYFAEGGDGAGGEGGGGIVADITGGAGGAGGAGGNEGGEGGNTFDFEAFKQEYGKNYADKGFMQELTSPEKMFEKIDNMESMIGKKSAIPGENATDKDWDEYRSRIGLKSANDYTLSDSHLPEDLKNFHNGDFDTKVKEMFYEAGLSQQQAKIISEKYDKLMVDAHGDLLNQVAAKQKEQQISDAEFDKIADETWGNDREDVQNVAKALIQKFTPENLKPQLNNMDNKNLIIMASVLKGVSDTYISQDDLSALKGGTGGKDHQTLRQEAQAELAKLANMSPFDPQYAAQQQKVQDLYSNFSNKK